MANGWIFPSNNYGIITGIGEAGIETFKGSPYKYLHERYARILWMQDMTAVSLLSLSFQVLQSLTELFRITGDFQMRSTHA